MTPTPVSQVVFPPIEIFDNPGGNAKAIQITHPEFSCVCPKTGYPDFARMMFRYVPDKSCVELKSLKLYLAEYYGKGGFHEAVTQKVIEDFVSAVKPKWCCVISEWHARGGVKTMVCLSWDSEVGYKVEFTPQMTQDSERWFNI